VATTLASSRSATAQEQLLPGFSPFPELWTGPSPVFPSENSARWVVKRQRQAMIDAKALALFRGRLFVHRERLQQVVLEHAVESYRQRYSDASA
jgi:hypothetical protein